jgi:hypothetical protein
MGKGKDWELGTGVCYQPLPGLYTQQVGIKNSLPIRLLYNRWALIKSLILASKQQEGIRNQPPSGLLH